MAEALLGLRVAACSVPQPQSHRGRLLPAARLASIRRGRLCTTRAAVAGPPEVDEDEAVSIDNLHRFFDLNVGKWDGSFYIGFFPEEKAFSLRYQTAGMLETVLRVGVLGEDDTGEESPKNLKIPSRKASIVCENCLYSLEGNGRVRAFHIMDPKGVLDTLLVFHERQGSVVPQPLVHSPVGTKPRYFSGRPPSLSLASRAVFLGLSGEARKVAAMEDRRGRGDAMRQRPFASAAQGQERVFDGGGGGAGPGPAAFGSDFDQGSSLMALLGAGGVSSSQPPPPAWGVEEVTAASAINLVPQSFSMANYAPPAPSYQQPTSFAPSPLGGRMDPYPPYLLGDPPPQWPPPRSTPAASSLPPSNFTVLLPRAPYDQDMQLHAAGLFGVGSSHPHALLPPAAAIEQPAKDGYSWRKYGQKQLKDAESPRSYYKCTRDGCPVKKVVERSFDGFITEITYKGRHNHPRPQERGHAGGGNDALAAAAAAEEEDVEGPSDDDDDALHENDVVDGAPGMGGDGDASGQRVVKKPKIIIQTPSEVDLIDDGYRWRKYGQKVVKGNPRPRSYYKCTADNCNVRKQIERASTDPRCVLTTYTGRHNHHPPGRGADAAAGSSAGHPAPSSAGGSGTFQQTGGARQLKEES
ncbi:putative WRKY transcription factor 58 [Dichanthelium oligosanthes]|uniref:Putative WRKY transcription factor 58 n=1 Tax=Dichanthelium oligosanthes TaxID=888268 RepID=A0A1E5VEH5_9POAL|nr:putative WRKY transcription factor 58 [Dichanthelium oligosanthes]